MALLVPLGTKLGSRGSLPMEDEEPKSRARRAIERYRRLRQWVTDLQARRALRELARDAEATLASEPAEEGEKDSRDQQR